MKAQGLLALACIAAVVAYAAADRDNHVRFLIPSSLIGRDGAPIGRTSARLSSALIS